MTKNIMTRAQALTNAISLFDEGAPEVEVLNKLLVSITKPRKKSDAPSKTRKENLLLVDAAVEAMSAHGEPVNAKWLTEHVKGILTTQKAAAVMRLGAEVGKIEKLVDGRKVTYKVA